MENEIRAIAYDELFTSRDDDCYLGEGSFSEVHRCYHAVHGDVAVKILKSCSRNPIRSFNKEGLMHLKACKSDHILTLHGLVQKQNFVGLVLEYMPYGCLAELLMDPIKIESVPLPWTFRNRVLLEVASAINYLHNLTEDKRLIHCDLKADNILLNGDLHAKIGDFGGASLANYTGLTFQSTTQGPQRTDNNLLQYTLSYAAPEVLDRVDARRTPYMDIYSFAVVIYVTTSRCAPFPGVLPEVLKNAVKSGQRPSRNLDTVEEQLRASSDVTGLQIFQLFQHLMKMCWKQEPKDRLKMLNVRDSLFNKLRTFPESEIMADILRLKQKLKPGDRGKPANAVNVFQKFLEISSQDPNQRSTMRSLSADPTLQRTLTQDPRAFNTSQLSREAQVPPQPAPRQIFRTRGASEPHPQEQSRRTIELYGGEASRLAEQVSQLSMGEQSMVPKELVRTPLPSQPPSMTAAIRELESSFADPFLRQGNPVRMITDIAAIKNAQIGHGGWIESLMELRNMQGFVQRVENNGDVTVSFSGVCSHRFNPNSLVKIPSDNDLHVGDFVVITLEKELVEILQEGHGGWVDEMYQYFNQCGLIFRFLPDRDVLVVYKSGMYFRFNPEALCKTSPSPDIQNIRLDANPHIQVGDYVCHDMDDEILKTLQEHCGGWNSTMSELKGKVGKFVYADYHGRTFVAYSSKLCFVFNPAALNKLPLEEALRRFRNFKDETKRLVQARVQDQTRHSRFNIDDHVRVHLPLDIVIELQRGHGGWCYQMLEVYGMQGIVKDFDEGQNAQVLFDTGNKWTFNPAALERIYEGEAAPPLYVPPFRIGDKVRVRLKDLNNASLNKMRQAFKMLDIPEEKVEILMKSGTVLGIDDDIDVIVSFGDGKNYGLKPEQLEKL